jgi:hypothetical protein
MQRQNEDVQRYFSLPDDDQYTHTTRRCVFDRSRPVDQWLVAVACSPQDARLIADALNAWESAHVDTV